MKKDMDFSRAFGRADREFVYCVHSTLQTIKAQEETKMKKKMGMSVIAIALLLLLAMGTAIALGMHWKHIETAMDLAVESGAYFEWELDEKIRLIQDMQEDGAALKEDETALLWDPAAAPEEKERVADAILTRHYGEEEFLYYYTMAEREWGPPIGWTLEQKNWFYQMEREKGLYHDNSWIDLLPEENDISQEEAVEIAKKAIIDAFDLHDGDMAPYKAGVSFFITDTCPSPRWMIEFYLPRENTWQTLYSVLLTRNGEITEDADLGVWTPEHARMKKEEQAQKEKEPSDWEKRGQEKLQDMDSVYYNPGGGKNYHFIPDCPLVKKELLPLTALSKTDSTFNRLTPCPACVNNHDYWSLEDKILYNCGSWPVPEGDWLSSARAVEMARKALRDQGFTIDGLYPALYSQEMDGRAVYQIFFDRLEIDSATGYVLIEPVYTVIIDAKTGEIISARENQSNG